jgi:hypothetical protein
MKKPRLLLIAADVAIMAVMCGSVFLSSAEPHRGASRNRSVWAEIRWPFPLDQWGIGRAFRCEAADCGSELRLYLRAKIGFCNCASAIDDDEIDRVGDIDLMSGSRTVLGLGRPLEALGMRGRSRGYAIDGRGAPTRSALTLAFHDRCDMVVATVAVADEEPSAHETAVLEETLGL